MSTQKQPAPKPAAKLAFLTLIALALILSVLYAITRPGSNPHRETTDSRGASMDGTGLTEVVSSPDTETVRPASPKPAFQPLIGRWLREDGGYIIEISEILPDGTLKAGYFNPRPIHVSRAAAVEEAGNVKVGIELNDVNYPGCLYTLVFNKELDQLQGTYYQAAQGQTYEIAFVRVQEP